MHFFHSIICHDYIAQGKVATFSPLEKSNIIALQLHFIQCPFPNQIQFGLEKIHPKNASDFPNQFQFGLERKNGILQDADSKPNSDWFGKNWWPLSTSWKFQTKFSLVWKNHWVLSTPWTLNLSQFYCSSQPSMVHWLALSFENMNLEALTQPITKVNYRKGKHSIIHICLNLPFSCQYLGHVLGHYRRLGGMTWLRKEYVLRRSGLIFFHSQS